MLRLKLHSGQVGLSVEGGTQTGKGVYLGTMGK